MKIAFFTLIAILAMVVGISPAMADVGVMAAKPSFISGEALASFGMAGLIINKSTLAELTKNIKTSFQKVFDAVTTDYQSTTMIVPSTGSENDYKWLDGWPQMRKWIGDKVIKSLKAFKYVLVNEPYEATIEVKRDDIEDGNLAGYSVQAEMTGQSAGEFYDDLDAEVKNGAFVNECYDGQFFYDVDHPVEGADGDVISISNKGTAVLSNANLAAATASIGAARLAISSVRRDGGKKLKLKGDLLEVPSSLETTAIMLRDNEKLADGTPNPFRGTFKIKENSLLESDTAWFLHVTNKPVNPSLTAASLETSIFMN